MFFEENGKVYYEGSKLIRRREELGLTQAEFALRCKKKGGGTLSQRAISYYERFGIHRSIKPATRRLIEKAMR